MIDIRALKTNEDINAWNISVKKCKETGNIAHKKTWICTYVNVYKDNAIIISRQVLCTI